MIQQQVVVLGAALKQAANNDDWLCVAQVDQQIHELLQHMRQQTLNDATLAQLKMLQQSHQQVMEQCRNRMDELRHKLQQHQSQRQGLQAYSLFEGESGEMK